MSKNNKSPPEFPSKTNQKSRWKKYTKYGTLSLGAIGLGAMGIRALNMVFIYDTPKLHNIYKFFSKSSIIENCFIMNNVPKRHVKYGNIDGLTEIFIHLLNSKNSSFDYNRRKGSILGITNNGPQIIHVCEAMFDYLDQVRKSNVNENPFTMMISNNKRVYNFLKKYRKHIINGKLFDTEKSLLIKYQNRVKKV